MFELTDTMSGERHTLPADRLAMYSCGPTVYRPVHVGNLRTFLLPDLIRRLHRYLGGTSRTVMNITDVGHMTDELTDEGRDRMLLAADDEGLSAPEIAAKYTADFHDDCLAVGIEPFDAYPKASDHIDQIIDLTSRLLERGHAYEVDGTVFYDVTTFPAYGALSRQSLDDMRAGQRIAINPDKRNHQDFVLWVAAGPRRELVFDSPWGPGYPGWHIECSAMSLHHLGDRFDVHTGGVDNRFPHHEDEIAQSEGAVGHRVVDTWVHGEHLLMGQAKMAKSAGNVVTISTLQDAGHDPLAFRYLCFTARYRRQVDFTDQALTAAGTAVRRLREQVAGLGHTGLPAPTSADLGALADRPSHRSFIDALCDDLDLPTAVRHVHEVLGDDDLATADRWALVASWDTVLGLGLADTAALDDDLASMLTDRERARASGDYARADALRDALRDRGVDVFDAPGGTRWVRRRG